MVKFFKVIFILRSCSMFIVSFKASCVLLTWHVIIQFRCNTFLYCNLEVVSMLLALNS